MFSTIVCLPERYVILTSEAPTPLIIRITLFRVWHRVVWQIVTNFSEKPAPSVLRIRVRELVIIYLPDNTESLLQHDDIARMLFFIVNNFFSVVQFFLQLTLMFRFHFPRFEIIKAISILHFSIQQLEVYFLMYLRVVFPYCTLSCFSPCFSRFIHSVIMSALPRSLPHSVHLSS
jgi:hypothetical protein